LGVAGKRAEAASASQAVKEGYGRGSGCVVQQVLAIRMGILFAGTMTEAMAGVCCLTALVELFRDCFAERYINVPCVYG